MIMKKILLLLLLGASVAHAESLEILNAQEQPTGDSLDMNSIEFFTGHTWQQIIDNTDQPIAVTKLVPFKSDEPIYVLTDKLHEYDNKNIMNPLSMPTHEKRRIARNKARTAHYHIVFPGPRMVLLETRTSSPTSTAHEKKVPDENRTIDINNNQLNILHMSIAEYFQNEDLPKPLQLVEVKQDNHYYYFSAPRLQSWLQQQHNQNKPLNNPLNQQTITKNNTKAYSLEAPNKDLTIILATDVLPILRILRTQRYLDYSNGKFNEQELAQQSDEYLAEIVKLNLNSNNLTDFPEILQRMPNLQNLTLNNNQIDSFKDMPLLTYLEYLWLENNQIGSFEHMPALTNLRQLALIRNQIKSFEHMPVLTNLQYLWLNGNQIKSFEGMPALTNLRFLRLDGNQIKSFEHMPVLANLQRLWLDNNRIDVAAINTWKQEHPNVDVHY